MQSGRTLWNELCFKYYSGAQQAAEMRERWAGLKPKIDPDVHREVMERLDIQVAHAANCRDECLKYFQKFSGKPIVADAIETQATSPRR